MSHISAFIGGLVAFFVIVAAISRLSKIPQAPSWIDTASKALSNLFNGAFGI